MINEKAKLISENPWLRVYELEPNSSRYESKFLADGLEVSALTILAAWPNYSAKQRWEFGIAYVSKPTITKEDEKILDYLMSDDGKDIWEMIPVILTRLPDQARVLQFLKDRIEESSTRKANYYQALGLIGGLEAGPLLRKDLLTLEAQLKAHTNRSGIEIDFIACVEALWVLFREEGLKEKLKPFLDHADKAIQYQARQAFDHK
jgi:hypothetical protein